MITLTQQQLADLVDFISAQLATIERIQSVNTMAITPTTNNKKGLCR
jgi:hypothetical protein